jgi:hypothetical protein
MYLYDPSSKVYLGEVIIDLLPDGSMPEMVDSVTDIKPPVTTLDPNADNIAYIFNGTGWDKINTWHRRQYYRKSDRVKVNLPVGVAPDDTVTLMKPLTEDDIWIEDHWDYSLELIKTKALARVKEFYQTYLQQTTTSFPMPITYEAIEQLTVALTYAEDNDSKTMYLTDALNVNHDNIPLTEVKSILKEMKRMFLEAHQKKQSLRKQIQEATTAEAVDRVLDNEVWS